MAISVISVGVEEFGRRWSELLADIKTGKLDSVVVKDGDEAVAEFRTARLQVPDIYGRHKGSVVIPPGVDLTEPLFTEREFSQT